MYQVISIIEGVYYHEGFFDDIRAAREHRDWVAEHCYLCDLDYKVIVNELKDI